MCVALPIWRGNFITPGTFHITPYSTPESVHMSIRRSIHKSIHWGIHNIAAARAVDREFNYKFGSNAGDGRRGGCAPRTPLLSGGLRPPDPPKGAPRPSERPWLQRLVAFSRPSRLSGAAALPGADCFSQKSILFEEATCPGQLRCLGQNFWQKIDFFVEEATCPGQLRCLGQNFFSKNDFLLKKQLVPGSFAAWGRTFSRKLDLFWTKPLVPSSFAAWGRTFPENQLIL